MKVLIEDDASIQRAARCDGAHDTVRLAASRVYLAEFAVDCCPACLADVLRMARQLGVPYRLEPTVAELAVRRADCDAVE